jgi:hypothetical protein
MATPSRNILGNVNYKELLSAATVQHGDVAVAAVEVIKPWIICGRSNVIVPIKFGEGVIWAARLATQEGISLLQSSIDTLDYLKTYCPNVPESRLRAMCLRDNAVGASYMMVGWIRVVC